MSEHTLFMLTKHGLPPRMGELDESVDYLNSPSGIILIKTVNLLMESGYQGVVVYAYALSNGKFLWTPMPCMDTPEGIIVHSLRENATHGQPIPSVEESLATVERAYAEQGLPKPVKAKGRK